MLILDERDDHSVTTKLREMIRTAGDYQHRLRALWALSNLEEFDESLAREVLDQPNPWLRAWAVRLLGQLDTAPSSET